MSLSPDEIGESSLPNFILVTTLEIPASLLAIPVVYYCSRKKSQVIVLVLAGIAVAVTKWDPMGKYFE